MLVLSRRPDQTIILPSVGVKVRLLRINGKAAQLGIEAPRDMPVLREELATAAQQSAQARPRTSDHALRNQMSRLTLALHLVKRHQEAGRAEEAEAALARALALLEQPPDKPTVAAPRCRALVVEDDNNERELLAGLLNMNGCDCATAADGLDCLDYLSRHAKPDFVLLDMGLPRCDGPQTLQQIRSDPRLSDLKVFSISGRSPQELGLRTGPGGIDAWFQKPLNPQQLWEAMKQRLGRSTEN